MAALRRFSSRTEKLDTEFLAKSLKGPQSTIGLLVIFEVQS